MILKVNYSDLKLHVSELVWFIAQELCECNAGYIATLYIYIYIYIYMAWVFYCSTRHRLLLVAIVKSPFYLSTNTLGVKFSFHGDSSPLVIVDLGKAK
jgi:hypothetical protein